jgi:uncharacterized surface protein with fasciclin (FAS1) repeats
VYSTRYSHFTQEQLLSAGDSQLLTSLPKETVGLAVTGNDITLKGASSSSLPPAHIIYADILVTGGVMHVIDHVLIPSNAVLLVSLVAQSITVPQ